MQDIRELKTDKLTIASGHLDVGNGHKVYFEHWGNPKAKTPVLTFHGGPGSQYRWRHKAIFDPRYHRVIFFDQRGSGNSLPYGKLEHNTTNDLMEDAQKILSHLGIKHVYVFGRSWGSTLATLFTIRYPEVAKATLVGGVYTGSRTETEYVDQGHFQRFYPEVWERFVASVPAQHRGDPAQYHYQQLKKAGDEQALRISAEALENLELPLLGFDWRGYQDEGGRDVSAADRHEIYDHVPYRLYAHYLSQGCFLPDNYILSEAKHIKTPFAIVQGRYDMACPPAYKLHQIIRHSKLYITLAGHGSGEAENQTTAKALIDTMFV